MTQQKIFVAYGDRYGPAVIRAAESVIRTVAPDVDLLHGRIGADAYNNTSYALPPETMDLLSDCDAVLSGPVDMEGIPGRDPLTTIKKQMGMFMEYGEYFPLRETPGRNPIDLVVMSPTVESTLSVYETESLDGVSSEYYTSTETASRIFAKAMYLSEMKRKKEISFVSDNILYPLREKLLRDSFHRHFAATEFRAKDCGTTEIMFSLSHGPSSAGVLVCDIHSSACVRGLASGLAGGSGLMPHAYLGENIGLYMPAPVIIDDVPGRKVNPTSAILSSAVMLLNLGRENCYNAITEAVREMYRSGHTTPDMGGKLTTPGFAKGVKELILAKLQQ